MPVIVYGNPGTKKSFCIKLMAYLKCKTSGNKFFFYLYILKIF